MSYWKAITQQVTVSTANSTETPLDAGAIFIGEGESTLNVAGIQVSFKSDQNATIYVDQAPDLVLHTGKGTGATNNGVTLTGTGTEFTRQLHVGDTIVFDSGGTPQTRVVAAIASDTSLTVTSAFTGGSLSGKAWQYYPWDITDEYNYYASIGNFGITVQAINAYFRVRVINTSSVNQNYIRLQSVLCPVVEAVPRSLDADGHLQVHVEGMSDEYGFQAENTPFGELRVAPITRLVGASFEGATIDSIFWTASLANNGTATQGNNKIILNTTTTSANGSAKFYSVRRARYVPGTGIRYRSIISLSAGATDNVRKWGVAWGSTMPTITDGAYFQLSGTTFSIVTLKTNSPTTVSSGSFNGSLGATYDPGTTVKTYEIYWTNSKVYFVVGGEILHTVSASSDTWSDTAAFHIYMDTVNSNSAQTANTLTCRVASISRLGNLLTQPTSYYHAAGTTTGVNLKLGPGNLHSIIFQALNNAVVTLSDSTTTSTPVIWASTGVAAVSQPVHLDFKGLPFFNGLRLTVSGANAQATIIYE